MRKNIIRLLAPAGLAAAALAVGAAPAHADLVDGGTNDDGYYATVRVTLSGDVDAGLKASVPGPPPICWWTPVTLDLTDADAVEAFLTGETYGSGTSAENMNAGLPSKEYFDQLVEAAQGGSTITLYKLNYKDGFITEPNDPNIAKVSEACNAPLASYDSMGGQYMINTRFQAFPTGNPPAPATDPRDLAEYAFRVMRIIDPALTWNPKSRIGGASLANLATWMWVDDPEAMAQRQVVAEAAGVEVTVTANTGGMTVSSPVRSTECSASQARRSYAAGVDEGAACTLSFPRGSYGYGAGFEVQTSATWNATWVSNAGPGDTLPPRIANAETIIPVAESQSLVRSTR